MRRHPRRRQQHPEHFSPARRADQGARQLAVPAAGHLIVDDGGVGRGRRADLRDRRGACLGDDGDRLCLAAGAQAVVRPIGEREKWLAGQIGPALADQSMLFVGLDVIGGYVTEINVTSPTGIREIEKHFPIDIAGRLLDAIERRLAAGGVGPAAAP